MRLRKPLKNADLWLGKLTRLRAAQGKASDGARGAAPHKPLLLLAILDLAESGKLPGRVLTRTPGLTLRFRELGTLVADRWPTWLDLRLPFYHLKTQGFWQAFTAEMTPAQSSETCAVIELQPEFFDLLADRDFRVKARLVLASRYFTEPEQAALFEFLGLELGRAARKADDVLAQALAAGRRKGRSARFQVRVVDDFFTPARSPATGASRPTARASWTRRTSSLGRRRATTTSPTASRSRRARTGCSTRASGRWTTTCAWW